MGGVKLLGTVSGGSTKSANYFDSIGVNNYEFVYFNVKGVNSTGAEYRDGTFIRSDSLSVDTATGDVSFRIAQNGQASAQLQYKKTNNNFVFPSSLGSYNSTLTVTIYGVAI